MESLQVFFKTLLQGFRVLLWLFIIAFSVHGHKEHLDVCKALNVFGRYGYYSVSMKVFPRDVDSEPWIFREPVVDVFQNGCEESSCVNESNAAFNGEFHMEFCDNVDQLLEAYFREYTIELMDKPWHAFTGGWTNAALAKHFGIHVNYIKNIHSYILVRISRKRECKFMKKAFTSGETDLLPHVKAFAATVQVRNKTSVENFMKKYGSHYIKSFSTGNALYQVFAYHRPVFARLKARLQRYGVSSLTKSALYTFFSPWYAEHVGVVLPTSGNTTLWKWANANLTSKSHLLPYASLMRLYGDTNRLKELDKLLQNEALLSLELKTLAPAFDDIEKRKWFLEVLHNDIQLWEANL